VFEAGEMIVAVGILGVLAGWSCVVWPGVRWWLGRSSLIGTDRSVDRFTRTPDGRPDWTYVRVACADL
jgi:hypothetical protein